MASFLYTPAVTVLPGPRPTPEPAAWFTVADCGDVQINGAISWRKGEPFPYWTVDADGALVGPDGLGSVDVGPCRGCGRTGLQVSRARLVATLVGDHAGDTIRV